MLCLTRLLQDVRALCKKGDAGKERVSPWFRFIAGGSGGKHNTGDLLDGWWATAQRGDVPNADDLIHRFPVEYE